VRCATSSLWSRFRRTRRRPIIEDLNRRRRSRVVQVVRDAGILHFLPRLLAPVDFHRWIGIRSVPCGVVIMGRGLEARSFLNRQGLRENVVSLPV